ncbi:unnamed protein product [Polarella glacialis]|uniref:Uncharacterized protein n=1 Tax=Polarella glacialis TaxID=89957 RepID=A0A813FQ17_POLGL|nr:unnamed protein product [Polarella glacialis]
MQLELRNHAELTERQEALLFKLEEVPSAPPPLAGQRRARALRQCFPNPAAGNSEVADSPSGSVLVPLLHVESPEQAARRAVQAFSAGVHGIWLVNSGHTHLPATAALEPRRVQRIELQAAPKTTKTLRGSSAKTAEAVASPEQQAGLAQLQALQACFAAVRERFPDRWVGLVVPQLSPLQVFGWVAKNCASADGIWLQELSVGPAEIEWEGIASEDQPALRAVRLSRWLSVHEQSDLTSVRRARQSGGWLGLVFGPAAADSSQLVHNEQDDDVMGDACQALLRYWSQLVASACDVVVTSCPASGPGPGCASAKLRAMAPGRPLALHCSGHRGSAASDHSAHAMDAN